MALFYNGRKETFSKLHTAIQQTDRVIWMHCASLGEFEQGRPVLEKLKADFPKHKFVVTFFSPSGYEVRKNYPEADVVCYLPFDIKNEVAKFLDKVKPELAIIVKYEFWPNLLSELQKRKVQTFLISGIFRENQSFFKWYGYWMRKFLQSFSHFFVQNEISKNLLNSIGFSNVTVSGDTRFDRVYQIMKQNNDLPFIEEFRNNKMVLVAGSTWPEDEKLLVKYINQSQKKVKYIIAPHNIHKNEIDQLKNNIVKKVVLFSEKETVKNLGDFDVFIIDTIGILTKIYSYGNIAYVGGGYTKSGVHNVLEPATYGMPILIGPNYLKFNEVVELVNEGGCFSVNNIEKLSVLLDEFFNNKNSLKNVSTKSKTFVEKRIGATDKIVNFIKK